MMRANPGPIMTMLFAVVNHVPFPQLADDQSKSDASAVKKSRARCAACKFLNREASNRVTWATRSNPVKDYDFSVIVNSLPNC